MEDEQLPMQQVANPYDKYTINSLACSSLTLESTKEIPEQEWWSACDVEVNML